MRVLQVINGLDQGGAEAMVANTARWLTERGVTSAVATTEPPPTGAFFLAPRLEEVGVPLWAPGPAPGWGWRRRVAHLLGVVRAWKPDVIHAHLTRASMVARAVARVTRTPLVTSLHSLSYEPEILATYKHPASRKHDVARLLEGAITTLADDAVVAVGETVATSARRRLHLSSRLVRVVLNPVDFARLDAQPVRPRAELAREAGVESSSRWLVMTGRVAAPKGTVDAVAALGHLTRAGVDARLVVLGSLAERAAVEEVEAVAQTHGVSSRVALLGARHDVKSWLLAADLFLFPSRYEGLPLALVEAVGQGAVVVASDIPSNLEVVSPGETGHVFPRGDAAALARVVEAVLSGRLGLSRSAEARSRSLRERFGVERAMTQLIAVYRDVSR